MEGKTLFDGKSNRVESVQKNKDEGKERMSLTEPKERKIGVTNLWTVFENCWIIQVTGKEEPSECSICSRKSTCERYLREDSCCMCLKALINSSRSKLRDRRDGVRMKLDLCTFRGFSR